MRFPTLLQSYGTHQCCHLLSLRLSDRQESRKHFVHCVSVQMTRCVQAGKGRVCLRAGIGLVLYRVALSAGSGEGNFLTAKELIDSEDLEHTLFCRKAAFVTIYVLFQE